MKSTLPSSASAPDQPDDSWDHLWETVSADATEHGLSDMDVYAAWKLGLAAFRALRDMGGRLPHDGPEGVPEGGEL